MTECIRVEDKQDLQPGTAICVEAAGHKIALFNATPVRKVDSIAQ